MTSKKAQKLSPNPSIDHLSPATRLWFEALTKEYELESHHLRLLLMAGEAWDRKVRAQEALRKYGSDTFEDRFGQPHKRPEIGIELDSWTAFSKLIRELGLDLAPPPESRPYRRGGQTGG